MFVYRKHIIICIYFNLNLDPEGKQKDVSIQDHSSVKLKEDSCRKAVGDGSEYVTKQGVLKGRVSCMLTLFKILN